MREWSKDQYSVQSRYIGRFYIGYRAHDGAFGIISKHVADVTLLANHRDVPPQLPIRFNCAAPRLGYCSEDRYSSSPDVYPTARPSGAKAGVKEFAGAMIELVFLVCSQYSPQEEEGEFLDGLQ